MNATKRLAEQHPAVYRLAIGIVGALATFALFQAFRNLPGFEGVMLVEPGIAVGPALGLFWGWPAMVGCTVGMLASTALLDPDPALLALKSAIFFVYCALPYAAWYLIKRKSDRPYPRFDATSKAVLALLLFTLDAAVLALAFAPLETQTISALDINFARFLNGFLFLTYFSIPLLIGIERLGFPPLPPRAIKVPYVQNRRVNLTQRILTGFLLAVIFAVVLFVMIGGSPFFFEDEAAWRFAQNVAAISVFTAALAVFLFPPVLIVLHQLETQFARPAELLTSASREFVDLVAAHNENSEAALVATDVDPHDTKPKHEMADLFDSMNSMRHNLVSYINQLELSVAERERAATELAIASRIQVDSVPHDFSNLAEQFRLDIAAVLRPAREVGGDFYDVFPLSDHEVGIVIADVSDKGMPAALFMMRAQAEIREKMRSCASVGEALTQANQALCERNDTMLFVTVFACILNVDTGLLTYGNAGHNPPWIVRSGMGQWLQFSKPQLVMGSLGIMRYRTNSLYLFPGDSILLYTDGVTEAANIDAQLFDTQRLEHALEDKTLSPDQQITRVLTCIDDFVGEAPQADDITMVSMKWAVPAHTLCVAPSLDELDRVLAFIRPLCSAEGCSRKMTFDLCVAVEELFVNIARYGFPDGMAQQPVRLDVAVDVQTQRLHVRIADAGVAYNPLQYASERVEAERGSNNKVGGLGILLVRSIADSIAYERENDMNILRFTKKFI